MSKKQWAILTLTLLLGSLALIVGSVVFIDPFEIYHQATLFSPPIENSTQNYSNAGIAKSYEYDSVVIGSSMTENFSAFQLDELFGGRFVKLCINGGSPFNHKQMMDLAFGTHDVKRVLYGLDIESMTYFYKTPKCEMPEYLYDDDLFNDVQYWFNRSVLLRYIPKCLSTLGQYSDNLRDTMYDWGDLYTYGKDAVVGRTVFSSEIVEQSAVPQNLEFAQQTKLNMEYNIFPYLQAHPDTEFIIFFPPYSLARWYEFYEQGMLSYHLSQKEAIINRLLPYDNVRIYDFQAETDWITNLDHYIDYGHYGPWINDAMAQAISEDRNRITDVAQARANDAVLVRYVDHLRELGHWPDSFAELNPTE